MRHVVTHRAVGVHGVLSVLADASEGPPTEGPALPERLHWLPLSNVDRMNRGAWQALVAGASDAETIVELSSIDAIRPGEDTLQIGWLWVAGTITGQDEQPQRVFEPLITTTAKVAKQTVGVSNELRLTPLITDVSTRLQLESAMEPGGTAFGRGAFMRSGAVASQRLLDRTAQLGSFARRAAVAAGLDATELVPSDAAPATLARRRGLRIVVGLGLYAVNSRPDFSPSGSLRQWHERIGTDWTALHSLYLDRPPPRADPGQDLPSAYRLTQAQRDCVAESRQAPVTVIAGAPGTGKTHTIAAIVGDAVAHGQTVLVSAKSAATVEALTELLDRRPGPQPVVFGSSDHRRDLVTRLVAGEPHVVPAAEVEDRAHAMDVAVQQRNDLWYSFADCLAGYALMDRSTEATRLRDRLPGLSRPQVSLFEVQALARQTGLRPPAWYEFGQRRRWQRLCELLGVTVPPDPHDLQAAMALATAARHLHSASDPLDAGLDWEGLIAAEARVEHTCGEWMDGLSRDQRRLTRKDRGTRAALATALRSGRAKRRAKLAQLGPAVTRALPVWIGTLGDIDDLLPMHPAMFDLVVLDEASSVDQPRAATALLRGSRCVIAGDPQQLRHVSFIADDAVLSAITTHLPGAPPEVRAKLDIRANSIFDVAAATATVRHLNEHFRSAPHLFDFVGRRAYRDRVRVATSTPATEDDDRISVVRLDAARNNAKVVTEEVEWVMTRLAELRRQGADSVGVLSPFRAQADALEDAALTQLGRDGIQSLGLRIGTVHAFQGMERDVVLVSLGIGTTDGPGTWRFAEDPHLFAVMATRARQRMEWVVSAAPSQGSLIADYLTQATHPPDAQDSRRPDQVDRWPRRVVADLRQAGIGAVSPYRVGHHLLDVCIKDDQAFVGIDTTLHPDGPHAHIRRHLELQRNGWPLVTALSAVWGDRPGELIVHLKQRLQQQA